MRRPVDIVVLNTCTAGLQLLVGLVLGPPLLLIVAQRPVRETLLQLAHGLRCFMSGFNSSICTVATDALGAPYMLTFFIASTAWNAAAFTLLRSGGAIQLAVGSAVILPATLLAFVRPVCSHRPTACRRVTWEASCHHISAGAILTTCCALSSAGTLAVCVGRTARAPTCEHLLARLHSHRGTRHVPWSRSCSR